MKVVIIGGIAAGMSAAAKLRRIDKKAEILLFEKANYISFGACGLPYYIGNFFENHERMLVRTPKQAQAMGIDLRLRHEVLSVDEVQKVVKVKNLTNGEEFQESYDRLMIATGASAVIPPIQNVDLDNVWKLHSLEDGQTIREKLKDPSIQKVGIIGAGFIGLEVVEAVKNLGKEAIVFQLGEQVLQGPFDVEITEILENELINAGVSLYLNTQVVGLEGQKAVDKIITTTQEIDVDCVIIATGVRPNTAFLEDTQSKRLKNGAIIINEEGQTSNPYIYAAGDCATVVHQLKEEPAYLPLATNANKLGRIVGENLAGNHETFEGTLGSSCLKVLHMEAGRTGLTESEARALGMEISTVFITDKNHTDYYPGQEAISVKLIYDSKTKVILGGQIVGKSGAVLRTNVIATAIAAKMTTKQLGMLDLCYAPPFSRTWDVLNIAGNAAK